MAMVAIIAERRAELTALCRRYAVSRLEVFGSAATGEFDPRWSDVDLLVEFADAPGRSRFRDFFDFKADLERLFGRSVDLVEPAGIRNSYFCDGSTKAEGWFMPRDHQKHLFEMRSSCEFLIRPRSR